MAHRRNRFFFVSRSPAIEVLERMAFLPRFSRFAAVLPLAAATALFVAAAPACNGSLATVLSSDGGPEASVPGPGDSDGSSPGEGGTSTCVAKGGMCLGKSLPPAGYHVATAAEGTCETGVTCYVPDIATPVLACATDPDCNGDSSVSSLMGSCFHGVCICHSPYNVGKDGKCANIKLPDCLSQSGTCRQTPATCLGTETPTITEPSACGDLIEAVCCTATAACKGAFDEATPVAFECCSKGGGKQPAVCLNGWKTCPSGTSATGAGTVCN